MIRQHVPILIPAVLLLGALIIPLVKRPGHRLPNLLAFFFTLASFLFSVVAVSVVLTDGSVGYELGGWQAPIGIELRLDALSAFFCVFITGMAVFVFLHGRDLVARETPGKAIPFYSMSLLLLGGLTGIVLTGDLFNLYVFLEISSIAGYALVALGSKRAPVAAFRYVILGTIGASFYLLGVCFLFMVTGTLNMADMALILPLVGDSPAVFIGLVLIVMGIGLKMALFPMHIWMPDAYTYASSTATSLLAPIGTKVAAYVLLRTLFTIFDPEYSRSDYPIVQVVGVFGAVGIIWGSVLAICQNDLKRMLAYSSVAQVGYIALGIGLASPLGLIGAVLHSLNHAVMKACLFLVTGNLILRCGHADITKMDNSLRKSMPWTFAAFTVAAISMIGLPPTAGFFSKWYLVLGSWEQGNILFLVVILLSSLLNAVYFFRVIEKVYLRTDGKTADEEAMPDPERREVDGRMLTPVLVLAGGVIVLGLINLVIVRGFIELMIPVGL